jgi:alpha-L-arabinofuranosidase
VKWVDVAATIDVEGKAAAVFLFNRNLEKPQDVELIWRDATPSAVKQFLTITGPDLKAGNTFADPKRVTPQTLEAPKAGARMTLQLPARSYSVLSLAM